MTSTNYAKPGYYGPIVAASQLSSAYVGGRGHVPHSSEQQFEKRKHVFPRVSEWRQRWQMGGNCQMTELEEKEM